VNFLQNSPPQIAAGFSLRRPGWYAWATENLFGAREYFGHKKELASSSLDSNNNSSYLLIIILNLAASDNGRLAKHSPYITGGQLWI
jgi:hypothetical protein